MDGWGFASAAGNYGGRISLFTPRKLNFKRLSPGSFPFSVSFTLSLANPTPTVPFSLSTVPHQICNSSEFGCPVFLVMESLPSNNITFTLKVHGVIQVPPDSFYISWSQISHVHILCLLKKLSIPMLSIHTLFSGLPWSCIPFSVTVY